MNSRFCIFGINARSETASPQSWVKNCLPNLRPLRLTSPSRLTTASHWTHQSVPSHSPTQTHLELIQPQMLSSVNQPVPLAQFNSSSTSRPPGVHCPTCRHSCGLCLFAHMTFGRYDRR